jgi:hypothetical protein
MKNIVMCGGFLLALYALGKLLGRDSGLLARHYAMSPQPLPPCTYTYKDVTCNLN